MKIKTYWQRHPMIHTFIILTLAGSTFFSWLLTIDYISEGEEFGLFAKLRMLRITSARWETKCENVASEYEVKPFYEVICERDKEPKTIGIGSYEPYEVIDFLMRNRLVFDSYIECKWSQEDRTIPSEQVNCYQVLVREVD